MPTRNRRSRKPREPSPSPALEIREMELGDIEAVYQLGLRLFTADQWPTLYRSWDEYEVINLFATDGRYCLVAEAGGRVVGFALGTTMRKPRNPWRYGWLLWLGVSPRYKRHGIGTRLVNRLTDIFIENGARMMLVDTDAGNHDAIAFFHKADFGGEIHHVYLSRNLESHPSYIERKEGGDEEEG
jgi:ribosomal protein S18 acetylase RimI-like enzyme